MEEEEWDDQLEGQGTRRPSHPPNYTYISRTTETTTSRQAAARNLPTDHIHSTKVFRRNEVVVSGFIGCALYSLCIGFGSFLFGLLNGGLLLFALHLAVCLYLIFSVRNRYFFAKKAPLRFFPVLLFQIVAVAVVILRAYLGKNTHKRIFWLQLSLFGAPAVVYAVYFGALVLRSLGVQQLKSVLPNYYIYLNLVESDQI